MATRIYRLNRGETEFSIAEGVGSATTKTFEFTFDLAHNATKNDVLQALRMFENHILKGNFPPA